MSAERVLVVGTTADYISYLEEHYPGRAVFLTDRSIRNGSAGPLPGTLEEIVTDLEDHTGVLAELRRYLATRNLTLAGITCFDCETLPLAAFLGESTGLDFPAPSAVSACRSKVTCKRIWRNAGIPSPAADQVRRESDVVRFMRRHPGDVVLKPRAGSGSQLVFRCGTVEETLERRAFALARLSDPAFQPSGPLAGTGERASLGDSLVIEEFVEGPEYSCDLLLDPDGSRLIRLARKVMAAGSPLGTTLAYEVPALLPPSLDKDDLVKHLTLAARAVGLERALVMTDFVVKGNRPMILEMAPRPGGDCLPPLIRRSSRFDVIGGALDFAVGAKVALPPASGWRRLIGLRLLAPGPGIISLIRDRRLRADPRVEAISLSRVPGHEVIMPPLDYDSRVLGYVIFTPTPGKDLPEECREVQGLLEIGLSRPSSTAGGLGPPDAHTPSENTGGRWPAPAFLEVPGGSG